MHVTNCFHELTRVDGICSSDGFMGPTSCPLGPMLCSIYDVSRIMENEIMPDNYSNIEYFHGHTNFLHELASAVGSSNTDRSMGPTSYCLGPMLCSIYDVSRIMENEIMPDNYSNIEYFHGHTNFLHELASAVGSSNTDRSMGPTSYCLGPMLCSSADVSRIVGN